MKRVILLTTVALATVLSLTACPAPQSGKVIDRHSPGEIADAGRKGEPCWQLVISYGDSKLDYLCVKEVDWRQHPVGSKYP